MKKLSYANLILVFLSFALVQGITVSCKKKETAPSEYVKGLSDIAIQYNKSCPKDEANGTKLESVTFADNTMTFRLSLSDQAIVTVNLDNTRDSIIHNMSDKLKNYLVKGNCNLEYKYVSPNDSSSITIVPNELSEEEQAEK